MLRVDNLVKDFGKTRAVNNLSFELGAGQICGFVGPNGAGKTTTMRIIATLDDPTEGNVLVEGDSIYDEPYRIRRKIGFMPDHYGTYPFLLVRDYLEFYARAYEIEPRERFVRIGQIMEFTGLDKIADKEVESLSKGMRQRLNLGRALIHDPKILVMDEPAAGLDPRARIELRYLIRDLATMGKTVFISSHILTELAEFCESLLIIDQGRQITFGTFEDLQKRLQQNLEIVVRLVDGEMTEQLERFLVERPMVKDTRALESNRIGFAFSGGTEEIPALLREMVMAGFPIIELHPQQLTMEDVFLQITQGEF
jgi:ABC-2 type transport system ATP-binding protein